MKIIFNFLYKSDAKESFNQVVTEENQLEVVGVLSVIETSMRDGVNACITFENEGKGGHYIRMSEVARVTTKIVEGDLN